MIVYLNKNLNDMTYLIREISKLIMFIVTWTLPVLLSRWNENNHFLWLFILSLVVTVGIFQHYEELEKVSNFESVEDGTDE